MQLHSTYSNALGEKVSTATNWAAYQIEELLGKDYDNDFKDDHMVQDRWVRQGWMILMPTLMT